MLCRVIVLFCILMFRWWVLCWVWCSSVLLMWCEMFDGVGCWCSMILLLMLIMLVRWCSVFLRVLCW